ncbi:hypothetical protein C8Q76DRAFT_22763 [Earliella scabrosa]|nr:hypothetical protein C8Q76DRAFT_22415 [Earliella scabrosa]KAI0745090.1 hypothetical protein C8Q76DRAFT_22763 [Earliella scabrosa]
MPITYLQVLDFLPLQGATIGSDAIWLERRRKIPGTQLNEVFPRSAGRGRTPEQKGRNLPEWPSLQNRAEQVSHHGSTRLDTASRAVDPVTQPRISTLKFSTDRLGAHPVHSTAHPDDVMHSRERITKLDGGATIPKRGIVIFRDMSNQALRVNGSELNATRKSRAMQSECMSGLESASCLSRRRTTRLPAQRARLHRALQSTVHPGIVACSSQPWISDVLLGVSLDTQPRSSQVRSAESTRDSIARSRPHFRELRLG